MLRGLGDVRWEELSHAYGEALDTADLLQLASSPDADAAKSALSELYGSIFHQGSVYPATVAAVPFLAELARATPHGQADLVWMLGQLADRQHAYGDDFPDVRSAVAAQLPVLLALLTDGDPEVREAAAYAVAQAGTAAEPLWHRWRAETVERVQASLALALGMIDAAAAGPVLTERVLNSTPRFRVAAAVALLRAGVPWPTGTAAAVVAAIDDGAVIPYCWARGSDWFDELLVSPQAAVAVDLLRQLLRARKPKTREVGLWAASRRCDASRSAPSQIVALVADAVRDSDPGVRDAAVDALSRIGAAADEYADLLAGAATEFPQAAGEAGFSVEFPAVTALARLGDPRWIEPVCAAAAAGHRAPRLLDGARLTPVVLAAVRQRLAAQPVRADVLAGVLGDWRAEEAVPELLAAMPYAGPQVTWALLEIGHDDPGAVPHLHTRVIQFGDPMAALAIRRITGDVQPLLDLIGTALAAGRPPQPGPYTFVGDLGEALRPLLPAARHRLTGTAAPTYPQREAQILAARIVAALEAIPPVLPTVRAVLAAGQTPARAAADLIADLAPAHRDALAELGPLLNDRLGDRWSRVAAARALARLGTPTADLTVPLVTGVTDYAGRYGLATILELHAVEAIPDLTELVNGDNRLAVTSFADHLVWADELLSTRIRATITALAPD
ncbi:HEAT repeat domain-containing protein [Micromonospora sp. CPCC 205539]|uniref:HEAT repeat domain-containing protein n=1 Tax=Micromonospora sp. CPCC 205539 TaxID=3122408 RepID=UPI002FEFD328